MGKVLMFLELHSCKAAWEAPAGKHDPDQCTCLCLRTGGDSNNKNQCPGLEVAFPPQKCHQGGNAAHVPQLRHGGLGLRAALSAAPLLLW